MEVSVPAGVSPGQMIAVQTPSGQTFQVQVPDGLQPGQKFQMQLPQAMSGDAAAQPAFILSGAFAGPKPGYAFKAGAQGMGYYSSTASPAAPLPQVMSDAEMAEKGLYSVANMYGTWYSCLNWLTLHEALWVSPSPGTDSFQTQSTGWCGFMCPCVGAHGFPPLKSAPRQYERAPGTNTFKSGQHTAVLMGERTMTVDGRMYDWNEWLTHLDSERAANGQ